MGRISLIDGNSIGYASQNTTRLTAGDRQVQAIFGFLRSMRGSLQEYPQFKPLILWDHKAQWRFDLYPHYKSKRNKSEQGREMKEQYKQQQPDIMKGMRLLGVDQLMARGQEADDMAGVMSKRISKSGTALLISGDQDWLQLVGENVAWFDPIRDYKVNHKNFAEFTGYPTQEMFLQGKALVGDSSDCIQGVGGIGEKTAPDFVLQYGGVEKFFELADAGKLPAKLPKAQSRFANNELPPPSRAKDAPDPVPMRDAYRRNFKLMNLRDAKKPPKEDIMVTHGALDREAFREFCEELSFASILRNFDSWVRPFETKR